MYETTASEIECLKMSEGTTKSALRRKSSGIASLMTLNLNNFTNIPIINEPASVAAINSTETTTMTTSITGCPYEKKKSLRFDTSPCRNEYYESEEVKEVKKRITDEIKRWANFLKNILFIDVVMSKTKHERSRGILQFVHIWKD